jgi:hydroxymethylbilane synthase
MIRNITIGTRGSQLALWQARWAKANLEKFHPGLEAEIRVITTRGDRVLDVSLPKLGEQGKGLFTKELEDEMLAHDIDVAVHSLKDLPTEITPGLTIGAIGEREDVRDALVARSGISGFNGLPIGARIGTSSLRRQSQLHYARSDLALFPIRGNVDTRLRKLDSGDFDAVVLASAGLRRLGRADRITEYLSEDLMLPAVGQGALAIQIRADDQLLADLVMPLDHRQSRLACSAERAFLRGLGGGCLVPIAALATVEDDTLTLRGLVASPDGSEVIRGLETGPAGEPDVVGDRLACDLLGRGADRLLAQDQAGAI